MMAYYIFFCVVGLAAGMFLDVWIECLIAETSIKEGLKKRLRLPNPLVMFLTAIIFMLLLKRYSISIEYFAAIFLMALLIAVFYVDSKRRIIPNELVLAGLLGSVLLLASNLFGCKYIFGEGWQEHLLGLLPGSGFLMLVALLGKVLYKTDNAMGMGDIKIYAPIGLILGWKLCMVSVFIAMAAAAFTSIGLLVAGKKKRKDSVPFGPFIAVGTLVALLWGHDMIKGYMIWGL